MRLLPAPKGAEMAFLRDLDEATEGTQELVRLDRWIAL